MSGLSLEPWQVVENRPDAGLCESCESFEWCKCPADRRAMWCEVPGCGERCDGPHPVVILSREERARCPRHRSEITDEDLLEQEIRNMGRRKGAAKARKAGAVAPRDDGEAFTVGRLLSELEGLLERAPNMRDAPVTIRRGKGWTRPRETDVEAIECGKCGISAPVLRIF